MNWLKASSVTALAQIVRLLCGLIIIKLIAMTLGTDGFGRLGHFMSLVSILSVLAGGGILNGIVKYVAEYRSRPDTLFAFLSNAALYSLIFSSVLCVVMTLFSENISVFLFDNGHYSSHIVFLGIIQFAYGLVTFCNGIINGLTETRKFARISIIGSLFSLPIACLLLYQYGFSGAVAGLAIINASLLPPALFEIYRLGYLKKIRLVLDKSEFAKISRFSVMQIVSLATLPVAEIVIRNSIAQHFGWQETGLWQGLMRLSSVYVGFFTMFLGAYYLPILSGLTDRTRSFQYAVKYLVSTGSAFFVIAVAVFVFRHYVFIIVFSDKFIIPTSFVQYQLTGDFFKIASYVIGFLIVAKANSTLYILGEIIQTGLYFGISIGFIQTGDVTNVFAAYALSNFLYFLVCLTGLLMYGRHSPTVFNNDRI